MARKNDLILEMDVWGGGGEIQTRHFRFTTRWLGSWNIGSDGGTKSMAFEGTVTQWLFLKLAAK